jgi:hypothetical protein
MKIKLLFAVLALAIMGEVVWAVFYLANPSKFSQGRPASLPLLPVDKKEAVLFIDPPFGEFRKGTTVEVGITLDSKGNLITGVDVVLRFDPVYLEVVDANPKIEGIQITSGVIFSDYLGEKIDPSRGKITISGLAGIDQPFSGRGVLAKVEFLTKTLGTTKIFFEFQAGATTDSNVVDTFAKDILGKTTGGEYNIRD